MKETRNKIDDKTFGGTLIHGYVEIRKPTFNTKSYREKYEKFNKLIQKLEIQISSANYSIEVDIPDDIIE